MDYVSWMKGQFAAGKIPADIANSALHLPLALPGGLQALEPLLRQVATQLGVELPQIHVVGSTRFGFSLLDGARFDSRYSDLDLAVVDARLYQCCRTPANQFHSGPRFPEFELPPAEGAALRCNFDELSRSVMNQFAYISTAVYPDRDSLVNTLAARIKIFLGVDKEPALQKLPQTKGSFDYGHFDAALRAGLPRFLGKISASNPSNATPYLTDRLGFQHAFGSSSTRRKQLAVLDEALLDLTEVVEVLCCLVGGSFVDPKLSDPHDLDLVVFYRALGRSDHEPGRALSRLSRKFQLRGIDARFVPCDAEPWLLIKLTSFFTSLYHADRTQPGHQRGLVLLILDTPSDRKAIQGSHDHPCNP